jgi:hypothetical protein
MIYLNTKFHISDSLVTITKSKGKVQINRIIKQKKLGKHGTQLDILLKKGTHNCDKIWGVDKTFLWSVYIFNKFVLYMNRV